MADDVTRQQLELDVARFLEGLRAAETGLKQFSDRTRESTDRMNSSFNVMGVSLNKLKEQFSGLIAPLVQLGSVAGFIAMMRSAGEAAEQIEHLRIQSGMTAAEIQSLQVLLNRVGLDTSSLTIMIRTLSRQMVEARDTTSAAAERFKVLGVTQEMLKEGNLYPVLEQIAVGLRNYATATDQATVMTELMSRAGIRMMPLLLSQPGAFKEAAAASREMGEMNEQQVKSLAAMDDQLDDLNMQFTRWKNVVSGEFAPVMKSLTVDLMTFGKVVLDLAKASGALDLLAVILKLLAFLSASLMTGLKGVASALAFVGDALVAVGTFDWKGVGDAWSRHTARMAEDAKKYQEQVMAIYPPDLKAQYGIVEPTGKVPPARGTHTASEADERKKDLAAAVAASKQEYERVVQSYKGFKAEASAYYRFLDAQRKEELNKSDGSARDKKRIDDQYWTQRLAFEQKHKAEELDLLLKGLIAEGEQREKFNTDELTRSKKFMEDRVSMEKAKNFDTLSIHRATLEAIDAAELLELYKNRKNAEDLKEIRARFAADRVAENTRYETEEGERRDKFMVGELERQLKLDHDILAEDAHLATERYNRIKDDAAASWEVKRDVFAKSVEAERRLQQDNAQLLAGDREAIDMAASTKMREFEVARLREQFQLQIQGQVLLGQEKIAREQKYYADSAALAQAQYKQAVTLGADRATQEAAFLNMQVARYAQAIAKQNITDEEREIAVVEFNTAMGEDRAKWTKKDLDDYIAGATAKDQQDRERLVRLASAEEQMAAARHDRAVQEYADIKTVADLEIARLEAERRRRVAQVQPGTGAAEEREAINAQIDVLIERQKEIGEQNFFGGLRRGLQIYMTDLSNTFNYAVDFVRQSAQAMQQAMATYFFDFMKGKIHTLKEMWEGFRDFIYKVIADIIARLLVLMALRAIAGIGSGGATIAGESIMGATMQPMSAKEGGWARVPRYQFGGPTFLDADRYPALLRRGEFVLNPRGVDTLTKINQGQSPFSSGLKNVNVNIVNSGRTDKPRVTLREQMEGVVLDIIFKNSAQNGPARGFAG